MNACLRQSAGLKKWQAVEMASVNVTINGRSYQIACDDGQEAHLKRLGSYIDKRIAELVASVGQIGDRR